MGKKAVIAAFGMNSQRYMGQDMRENMKFVLSRIDSVKGCHPDLICLPEACLFWGGDAANPDPDWAEIYDEYLTECRKRAKAYHTYIITSYYHPAPEYPGHKYNCGVVIDRNGDVQGVYRKQHAVDYEISGHKVIPVDNSFVFDTDFGKVGVLICFDIGWRDAWQKMEDDGAQMVVWLSAYDGGNLLNAYAQVHNYYICTAVRSDHARICDMTGRNIALGATWNGLAMATIDLSTELFHTDNQAAKIDEIRAALGDKVTIKAYSQENYFTLESNDEDWSMERIKKEFGLVNYKDYHASNTAYQEETKRKYPAKPRLPEKHLKPLIQE